MNDPGSLIRALSGRMAARNFHSYVINEIGAGIVSGHFPVGGILPKDSEMMDMYNVSRTVLREALKTLEAKGLVEARPKVGTRVAPASHWNLFDQQVLSWHFQAGVSQAFLNHVCIIRMALQREAVRLAARHRTADHLRMMNYWLRQMDRAEGPESHALAELEVHRVIADASRNPLLFTVSAIVEFAIAAAMNTSDTVEPRNAAHLLLVEAIEAGNALAAEAQLAAIVTAEQQLALTLLAK